MRSSPPNYVRTLELPSGALLVLAGPDNEVQITLLDAEGEGSSVNLSLDEANLVQSALLDRILHIEARQRR